MTFKQLKEKIMKELKEDDNAYYEIEYLKFEDEYTQEYYHDDYETRAQWIIEDNLDLFEIEDKEQYFN